MIISATTNQKFRVSDEWMKACGLHKYDSVFAVKRIDDLAPGLVMVVLESDILGHGGEWVVNVGRGEFVA